MIYDLIMTWVQRRNVVGFYWKLISMFVESKLSQFFYSYFSFGYFFDKKKM